MIYAVSFAAAIAVLFSPLQAKAAAILNGSFSVLTSSSQIGIVNDSTGFTNLTLASGVPQSTNLFDIFALSPVTAQPISVSFSFVQTGIGAISALVTGTISASSGANSAATVSFAPSVVQVPSYGVLSIGLSSASFASDFNGTVNATFVETVPEPSSASLLGLSCIAAFGTLAWGACRRSNII